MPLLTLVAKTNWRVPSVGFASPRFFRPQILKRSELASGDPVPLIDSLCQIVAVGTDNGHTK
jgi:hypothetical protein